MADHRREIRSGFDLSRPRQKRELNESLADLTGRMEALNASITKLSEELASAHRQQVASEEELGKARLEFDQAQSAAQRGRLNLRRLAVNGIGRNPSMMIWKGNLSRTKPTGNVCPLWHPKMKPGLRRPRMRSGF